MTRRFLTLVKAAVIVACILPFTILVGRIAGFGDLGANPIQEVMHTLGKTGLNLLLLTLAITPARKLTGLNWLVALRRALGLAVFGYILLHALTYVILDQGLAWSALLADVTQRPFIAVGVTALLLLLPLAVTSTNKMQRRLGRHWVKLHRSVYLIGVLGVLHFFWQVKITTIEPLVYTIILTVLLGFRATDWLVRPQRRPAVNRP